MIDFIRICIESIGTFEYHYENIYEYTKGVSAAGALHLIISFILTGLIITAFGKLVHSIDQIKLIVTNQNKNVFLEYMKGYETSFSITT